MLAPLSHARQGEPLPGVAFGPEAVANAFVMLGLLPEARAEEILAEHRSRLQTMGFQLGVLTGELSVRPGAYGFQDAQTVSRDSLTRIPLAVAAGPVALPMPGMDLNLTWATLTPGGAWLRLQAARPDDGRHPWPPPQPTRRRLRRAHRTRRRLHRMHPGSRLGEEIRSGLSVTDNLGRKYQLRPSSGRGTITSGPSGQRWQTWDGEIVAEPEPHDSGPASAAAVQWLEFTTAHGSPVRVPLPAPDSATTGTAEPPWPTPAEGYLAALASVTSMSMSTGGHTVELDTARIVAAVADALLWTGALPPDSALLSGTRVPDSGQPPWRNELMHSWARQAHRHAHVGQPHRAALAVTLPLREATAVIESITAHENLISLQLYGHPWVNGEYWPMITPCFQVRAVDDTRCEHDGIPGGRGRSPEGSGEFWLWPPVAPAAKRIRVIVSTLWEAAWAEIDIPGRPSH
jgi:hypothetical protein